MSDLLLFQRRIITYANEIRTTVWEDDFQEWGEAERLSEQQCRFFIRYRQGIAPNTHKIIFFGQIWTITAVVPDRKHTMLTIDSDFSDQLEATHMQSEEREYVEGLPVVRTQEP